MTFLQEIALFLAAATIFVPLFNRLGLGSVLGFLAAGVAIGPSGLGLITNVDEILHIAEIGVVLLLFIIGLELRPARLWVLRGPIFGLGTAQVVITGLLFALLAWQFGLDARPAILVGFSLALSSTAFALQLLEERKQMATRHGQAAFAVLLFQDLAIVPLLALAKLLAGDPEPEAGGGALPELLLVAAAILGLVFAGHFALRPLFRAVAPMADVFTGTALLVVLGAALLMEQVGVSMAMGAFVAGVMLADSEYRHELEATIEPFKALLLGLFFLAVGMSMDLKILSNAPLTVLGLVAGMVLIKAVVLSVLGRIYGLDWARARRLGVILSQGGEFAFVLLGAGVVMKLLDTDLAGTLILVVTLSMMITPLLATFTEGPLARLLEKPAAPDYDTIDEPENPVILAGFGRFGQIVGRILALRGIHFTALEASAAQVDFVRRFGNRVFYGDPTRLELLRSAGARKAQIMIIAMDDTEATLALAQLCKRHFPQMAIYARARNRRHAHMLMDIGVDGLIRDTFLSSLELTRQVLVRLGDSAQKAEATVTQFKEHDEATLIRQHAIHHDELALIQTARDAAEDLRRLFESDANAEAEIQSRAGNAPPEPESGADKV
jgi:glutathione-regulated potassium-efflux system ancillary protein KefC/glutathione-regulated potassium-efflux system protein KefB